MKAASHHRYRELAALAQKLTALATSWEGVAYRSVAHHRAEPNEILSGEGSFRNGGRWNAPGSVRAVYASITPETAIAECLAHFRYYGFRDDAAMPRLIVAIEFRLGKVIDLTNAAIRRRLKVTSVEIWGEDWRKTQDRGHESLAQAIGRALAEAGMEAIITPSVQVRQSVNIVYFPENRAAGSMVRVVQRQAD
jgi:RES domain-containing protein